MTYMKRSEIRAVLVKHGITIPEGQEDLRPHVYEAIEDLLSRTVSVNDAATVIREALLRDDLTAGNCAEALHTIASERKLLPQR